MDGKALRIVFMGTPDFAVASLRALVEGGYNVVGVITSPDKPAGRGLKLQQSAVKQYAVEAGLHLLQPPKLKDESFVEEFRALQADLGIVIAFRMLPEVIWSQPRLGTFNLHASLLPQYRGAAPINWAIINGETRTGNTTFLLNHEIDKGDILGRSEVEITPVDNAGTLHDKLMDNGRSLVVETVERLAAGDVTPIAQQPIEPAQIHEAPKLFKETCCIDWSQSCAQLQDFIRGLSPYPAAWCPLVPNNNEEKSTKETLTLKIFETKSLPQEHTHPVGTILTDGKNHLHIACADGFMEVETLQLSGKKRMRTPELLRGLSGLDQFHAASNGLLVSGK